MTEDAFDEITVEKGRDVYIIIKLRRLRFSETEDHETSFFQGSSS